jgi:hypothetical protein
MAIPNESMLDAVRRLQARGFTHELRAARGLLRDVATDELYEPERLRVAEKIRFEGASDPDELAILFAFETEQGRPLGTYATPYGPATPAEDAKILRRLAQPRPAPRTASP